MSEDQLPGPGIVYVHPSHKMWSRSDVPMMCGWCYACACHQPGTLGIVCTRKEHVSHTENDRITAPIGQRKGIGKEEIRERLGFHKGTIEGPNATAPRHAQVREAFIAFADFMDELLPVGRCTSLFWTNLEQASMWAHKGVANLAPVVDESLVESETLTPDLHGAIVAKVEMKCYLGPVGCYGDMQGFRKTTLPEKPLAAQNYVWVCDAHLEIATENLK